MRTRLCACVHSHTHSRSEPRYVVYCNLNGPEWLTGVDLHGFEGLLADINCDLGLSAKSCGFIRLLRRYTSQPLRLSFHQLLSKNIHAVVFKTLFGRYSERKTVYRSIPYNFEGTHGVINSNKLLSSGLRNQCYLIELNPLVVVDIPRHWPSVKPPPITLKGEGATLDLHVSITNSWLSATIQRLSSHSQNSFRPIGQ